MLVYLKNKKADVAAVAEYNLKTNQTVVLKGSIVSADISQAPTFKGKRAIKKAREGTVKENILLTDIVFKSPSTAGNFVTGRSTDGLSAWKDGNGKSIKKILNENKN